MPKKNTKTVSAPKEQQQPKVSQATKTAVSPEKHLNRAERNKLIEWWRDCGWTYKRITDKFAEGITEEEYAKIQERIANA